MCLTDFWLDTLKLMYVIMCSLRGFFKIKTYFRHCVSWQKFVFWQKIDELRKQEYLTSWTFLYIFTIILTVYYYVLEIFLLEKKNTFQQI